MLRLILVGGMALFVGVKYLAPMIRQRSERALAEAQETIRRVAGEEASIRREAIATLREKRLHDAFKSELAEKRELLEGVVVRLDDPDDALAIWLILKDQFGVVQSADATNRIAEFARKGHAPAQRALMTAGLDHLFKSSGDDESPAEER